MGDLSYTGNCLDEVRASIRGGESLEKSWNSFAGEALTAYGKRPMGSTFTRVRSAGTVLNGTLLLEIRGNRIDWRLPIRSNPLLTSSIAGRIPAIKSRGLSGRYSVLVIGSYGYFSAKHPFERKKDRR